MNLEFASCLCVGVGCPGRHVPERPTPGRAAGESGTRGVVPFHS